MCRYFSGDAVAGEFGYPAPKQWATDWIVFQLACHYTALPCIDEVHIKTLIGKKRRSIFQINAF